MWIDLVGLISESEIEKKLQMIPKGADFIIGARIKKTNYLRTRIYNARLKPEYWHLYSDGGCIELVTTVFHRKDEFYEDVRLDPHDFYIPSTIAGNRNIPPASQEKIYIQAFDELEWYIIHDNVYISTDEKYRNPYHATVIEQEQTPLSRFLNDMQNVKAYAGLRHLHEATNIPDDITDKLNSFYKRWDCEDSIKIQEWYYQNNSEYRVQFDTLMEKTIVDYDDYDDVYFSNLDEHFVKKIVQQNIGSSYESQSFYGGQEEYVSFGDESHYYGSRDWYDEQSDANGIVNPKNVPMIYEPSDATLDRINEEAYAAFEYDARKRSFDIDNSFEDYDDHLYFERLRDDEE